MDWVLRIVAGGLALFLFYVALFMYEDEEGKLQNALEDYWVRIVDLKRQTGNLLKAVLIETAKMTRSFLDRLFGERLFSTQAIGVSICYSMASIVLYLAIFVMKRGETNIYWWITPAVFLLIGSLPALATSQRARVVLSRIPFAWSSLCLVIVTAIYWELVRTQWEATLHIYAGRPAGIVVLPSTLAVTLGLVIAAEIGWIWLVRKNLSLITANIRAIHIFALIAINAVAIALVLAPAYYGYLDSSLQHAVLAIVLQFAINLFLMSRLIVLVTALPFLVVLLTFVLHRLLWPILERSVYAAARHRLLMNKKLLATAGVSLATASSWNTGFSDVLASMLSLGAN